MNFSQPPPNYRNFHSSIPVDLNQPKFSHPVPNVCQPNASHPIRHGQPTLPRPKHHEVHKPNIPTRHFICNGHSLSSIPVRSNSIGVAQCQPASNIYQNNYPSSHHTSTNNIIGVNQIGAQIGNISSRSANQVHAFNHPGLSFNSHGSMVTHPPTTLYAGPSVVPINAVSSYTNVSVSQTDIMSQALSKTNHPISFSQQPFQQARPSTCFSTARFIQPVNSPILNTGYAHAQQIPRAVVPVINPPNMDHHQSLKHSIPHSVGSMGNFSQSPSSLPPQVSLPIIFHNTASATLPNIQIPPPVLFSHPPPNYNGAHRLASPSRQTLESPLNCGNTTVNDNSMQHNVSGFVPVLPLAPASSTNGYVSKQGSDFNDIPDLRHQFLSNQLLPQTGQIVLLPPLPPDRSVQTIQLLTPASGGQFSVQTIVLPIVKVENTQELNQVKNEHCSNSQEVDTIHPPIKKDIIKNDNDDVMLNEVDLTGLPKVMQGIDLEKVKQFAADFKAARLSLGLTQTQVGQALTNVNADDGVAVSQSTICRFEKLEITALQVKKLLPALQSWLNEVKERQKQGLPVLFHEAVEGKDAKKRKKRTVFNQDTVDSLCKEFEKQPSPSSQQLGDIADKMGLDKETVRVWFCNRRQNLKKSTSL